MPNKTEWEKHRWRYYDHDQKETFFLPILEKLVQAGLVGDIAVDVWSGSWSIVQKLISGYRDSKRKIIHIDIANKTHQGFSNILVPYDIENIIDTTKTETQKTLETIADFLWVDCNTKKWKTTKADSMFFSEILNYVDYQSVLLWFSKYLKQWGIFAIINMPGRWFNSLFSEKWVKSNSELKTYLESIWFEIIEESYPWSEIWNETDTSMMVLIAQKK